jgi:chaperonin GroEL (HSP60 family)
MMRDSNPQNNQSQNKTSLGWERVKTALCAIPLILMEYAAVNYGDVFAEQSPRGERTELVRLTRENAR